jgi:GNAT superfamily N-acetyltransferase
MDRHCDLHASLSLLPADGEVMFAKVTALVLDPQIAPTLFVAMGQPQTDGADALAPERWWAVHAASLGVVGALYLHEGEVAYCVAPSWQGQGVAVAMLARVCADRRMWGGATMLKAEVMRSNPASIKVLERAGFVFAGLAQRRWRDTRGATAMLRYVWRPSGAAEGSR